MRFILPRRATPLNINISGQTAAILDSYTKYTGHAKEYIVDEFLKNLLADPNFARYIRGQRRNKRIINQIFAGDQEMKLLDEYAKEVPVFNFDDLDDNANDKIEEDSVADKVS